VIVFAVIDNLWKGAASQAVQNLNLMFGLPEGGGHLLMPVLQLAMDRGAGGTRPRSTAAVCRRGFRAAGVGCGIKESGAKDLALLVSDGRPRRPVARALQPLGGRSRPRCC